MAARASARPVPTRLPPLALQSCPAPARPAVLSCSARRSRRSKPKGGMVAGLKTAQETSGKMHQELWVTPCGGIVIAAAFWRPWHPLRQQQPGAPKAAKETALQQTFFGPVTLLTWSTWSLSLKRLQTIGLSFGACWNQCSAPVTRTPSRDR